MTLDEAIRQTATEDRLDGLTIWIDRKAGTYQAGFRSRRIGKSSGWNVVIDADPVTALLGALGYSAEPAGDIFG